MGEGCICQQQPCTAHPLRGRRLHALFLQNAAPRGNTRRQKSVSIISLSLSLSPSVSLSEKSVALGVLGARGHEGLEQMECTGKAVTET